MLVAVGPGSSVSSIQDSELSISPLSMHSPGLQRSFNDSYFNNSNTSNSMIIFTGTASSAEVEALDISACSATVVSTHSYDQQELFPELQGDSESAAAAGAAVYPAGGAYALVKSLKLSPRPVE